MRPDRVLHGFEAAAVQHQVTTDLAHTDTTQALQQQPQVLDHQSRVPVAAQVKVTFKHALVQRRDRKRFGSPHVLRSEDLQAGQRRDEFHRRRGVHRHRVVQRHGDAGALQAARR